MSNFGQSLFFEPVPQEMLVTAATRPQVRVAVDGVPAACRNLDCEYLYMDLDAEITNIEMVGDLLRITGVNLPVEADVLEVSLAGNPCVLEAPTNPGTELTCAFTNVPQVAGSFSTVTVIDANGKVKVADGISPIVFNLIVDGLVPDSGLNTFGGDILTISGAGFAMNTDDMSVTFSDGTVCKVLTTSTTQATCETEAFT